MLRWIVAALALFLPWSRPSAADETWPSIETDRTWVEYEVRADSFDQALVECRKNGKGGWAGFTEWDLVWRYDFSDYRTETRPVGDGQLLAVRDIEVTLTSVKVTQKTHLPKLVPGEAFDAEDKRRWERWYADLRAHEIAHQRVSSAAAIETWLQRRVAGIRYLERTFPAGKPLAGDEAKQVIRGELTEVYNHALARIRDKNEELDQRTAHGPIDFDWDEFLRGYF